MGLIEHLPVLPHQGELLRSRAPNKASPGGYGSGKTMTLVLGGLKLGQDNWPIPPMIVEPSFPMIRDVVVPQFEELAEEWGFYAIWNEQRQRIKIDLGDGVRFDVYLRSGDRPQSVVGVNASAVLIDEAGHQKDALIDKASKRARHPKAKRKEVWQLGTPDKLTGLFYEACEGKGLPGLHKVPAKTTDNFFLDPSPEEYIRLHFSNLSPAEREAYIDGRFVARYGRIYTFFDPKNPKHNGHCRDPLDGELVLLCDFGHNTMPWAIGRIIETEDDEEHLHIWGEVVGRASDTFAQIERTKEYLQQFFWDQGLDYSWPDIASRFVVYGDAAGSHSKSGHKATQSDIELLMEAGFEVRIRPKNPPVRDRTHSVQDRIRRDLLTVDGTRAKYILKCLSKHSYGEDGTPEKTKDDGSGEPALDHGSDAVGYGVFARWPLRAPRGNEGHHRC